MASAATARGELCRLRRDIARIEGRLAEADRLAFVSEGQRDSESLEVSEGSGAAEGGMGKGSGTAAGQAGDPILPAPILAPKFPLGLPALDAVLGGGLAGAVLHKIRAA
jgi:hypothetical protein